MACPAPVPSSAGHSIARALRIVVLVSLGVAVDDARLHQVLKSDELEPSPFMSNTMKAAITELTRVLVAACYSFSRDS